MSKALPEGALDSASSRGSLRSDDKRRQEQFAELAIPLTDLLYGAAARMLKNRTHAEDLVQETFIRAWKIFDRFKVGTNFKAWIFQILTYLYLNERRSAKMREVTVDYSENDVLEAENQNAHSAIPADVDWDALYPELVGDEFKRALERIKEEQRVVLMLVTLGDLSYKECAESLGIPIGTVMSRLFRARKQLQKELYDYALEKGLLGSE